jgi:hypothetical protein
MISSSKSLFQMVGATRGTPEGFRTEQISGSQPPSLPLPNLADVLARQTELLNLLVQAQQNQQRQQSRGRDEPQVATYQDFLSTQPPLSVKRRSPLMPMPGFAPLNPSLLFLRFPVRIPARLTSLHNNYAELPVFGGIVIVLCKLMAMLSPGRNSVMPSEHIIYLRD